MMLLKVPDILPHATLKCDVRGFNLQPGDTVKPGDFLAELRYEVIDDGFSDCPVVHYGDLLAAKEGVVRGVTGCRSGSVGIILGEIGDEAGDFPVTIATF